MKYSFIIAVTACYCVIALTGAACAQSRKATFASHQEKAMPQMLTAIRLPDSVGGKSGYVNSINTRVMRDFMQRYREADDTQWYAYKDGFIVKFTLNHHEAKAVYNNRHNWLYTIQTYFEEQMPRNVRATVKRVYYDYRITQIDEVDYLDYDKIYVVHLEDSTSYKNVRVCRGEMEVIKEFNKSRK